ncbi:MAG: ABC transporter ATP-binding protein [Planctomycetota bacterium]
MSLSLETKNRGEPIVQVRGVTKTYGRGRRRWGRRRPEGREGDGVVYALRGVDLEVFAGEYLSIMGPSGSGKSTLFNLIGALDKPTAGDVQIGSLSLPTLRPRQLAYVRGQHLGYVFQAYNLIPSLTAVKNVALPRVFAGSDPAEADAAARARLEQVGLGHRLTHRPGELSGGQQQRVAIARALVNDPSIILADEPTANLDLTTGAQIIELLKALTDTGGVTVISATHDHKMLANSDRVVWVRDGAIEKVQTARELDVREGRIEAAP